MRSVSTQTKMFRADGDPASASRPYVPVLLMKQGERQALEVVEASTRDLFTPWVRALPPEVAGKNGDRTRSREMGRIARASPEHAVYLDVVGTPRHGRARPRLGDTFVRMVYEDALAADLPFIPVFPFGRPDLSKAIASFQSPRFGAAVLVRFEAALLTNGRKLEDELRGQVVGLAIEPARLDVMIDIGYIQPGLADAESPIWLVRKIAGAVPWRSIILAGTSVPESYADEVPDGALGWVVRRERSLFDVVQEQCDVQLRFADYALQHPRPPSPGFMKKARANVRYTRGDLVYVARGTRALGETPRAEWPNEFRGAAEHLMADGPFAGVECCWGDDFVMRLADGRQEARSHSGMRAAATCHHLTVVAYECASRESAGRDMLPVDNERASAHAPNQIPLPLRVNSEIAHP